MRCPTCDREGCKANAAQEKRQMLYDMVYHEEVTAYRDCLKHAVDWRARALAAEAERDDARTLASKLNDVAERADRTRERMRDWCAAWLRRARLALYREGWEEGMSESEMAQALTDVLANFGCDEGTDDPAQVAEAARLDALPITYFPPEVDGE